MKCPYCYREALTHNHDPILLPNGAKYKFTDASETELEEVSNIEDRIYKGIYQVTEEDITELQTELGTLEAENGITPLTVFSPINNSGKFQITGQHIKEMRDSVEKLLIAFGLTKTDYFNYDADGNHITHPLGDKIEWTDPITEATDLIKFQIKYIHIEDLRHFIRLLWEETWTDNNPTWIKSSSQTINPFGTFFDSETKTIDADNLWTNCYYSTQANLGTVIPGQAGNLVLSSNVDLHLNSLSYASSLNFNSTNLFTLSYEFLNYFPGFTYLILNDIKIRNAPQLFWDGVFSGNISIASLGQNYAAIYLVIERVDTLTQTEFIFVKYGTNSLPKDNPFGSFKIVSLTDWTNDGIDGVNIYNSMSGFGFDMTKEYVIKAIRFVFYNAKAVQFAGGFPYSLTASLSVTLNNISIH